MPGIRGYLEGNLGISDVSDGDMEVFCGAFTTPGYASEHPGCPDYERLEFLGDAEVHVFVCRELYRRYPDMDEGRMTKLAEHVWSNKVYPEAVLAAGLDFTDLIVFSPSLALQPEGQRRRAVFRIVAACFESFTGALASLGYARGAEEFMGRVLLPGLDALAEEMGRHPIAEWDGILGSRADRMRESYISRMSFRRDPPALARPRSGVPGAPAAGSALS